MLLRESSAQSDETPDLDAVMDSRRVSGLRRGAHLNSLVEACIARDSRRLRDARTAAEREIGTEAVRDALIVAAGFDGITRVADATGIPLDPSTAAATVELRHRAHIDAFDYAAKNDRYS